jgi:hypothetical protein
MAIFGHTADDATASDDLGDEIGFCYFQMGNIDGIADSITAKIKRLLPVPNRFKCAIYDAALNLVINGVTEEKSLNLADWTWTTFNFTGVKPLLTANAYYYLCVWANRGWVRMHGGVPAGEHAFNDYEVYDGYPATLTKDETWNTFELLTYCTYTLVAANPLISKPFISPDIIKKAIIR